jgi:hypothetical protein
MGKAKVFVETRGLDQTFGEASSDAHPEADVRGRKGGKRKGERGCACVGGLGLYVFWGAAREEQRAQ